MTATLPNTLTSNCRRASSTPVSSTVPSRLYPASLISTSIAPTVRSTSSTKSPAHESLLPQK